MAFYEGIDEEIYEGGDHYVPMQQFRLNNFVPNINTTTPTSTTYEMSTLPAAPIIRNDPTFRGGGLHGNLDLSNTKNFTKNVWSEFAPGKFGWKEKEVEGFYNPTTNQYQTIEGKNINHLGLNWDDPEYGDIEGKFTGFPGIIGLVTQGIKRAKDYYAQRKIEKERDLQAEIDRHNQEAAVAARVAKGQSLSDIGRDMYTGEGKAFEAGNIGKSTFTGGTKKENVGGVPGGVYGSPKKDGGRVGLNYGGLASMLGREYFKEGGKARIGFFKGAQADTKEGKAMSPGTTASGEFRGDGGQGYDGNTVVIPKTNYIDIEPDLFRENPYVNINLTSPLNIAKLKARLGVHNILDNDDLYAEGDLTTNIGPVTTNTQFTDDGIGNTNINLGNFSTTIDPNKNIQNIGYNNSWNGINYGVNTNLDNTMFTAGISFKNGGLASIL
jgi:hypothetical protein|tara:strand:+ start:52 stop:1368 length:1317 start_codon:yes stop_codon:yes gene_type:complete